MIFEYSIESMLKKICTLKLLSNNSNNMQDFNVNLLDYFHATLLFPTFYSMAHLFTIPAVFAHHTGQKYLTYDVDDGLTNPSSKNISVVFGGSITNAIDTYNVATRSKWMFNEQIVPHDTKIVFAGYEGMPEDYNQEKLLDYIHNMIDEIYEEFPEHQIVTCSGHSMGGLMATEMYLQLQERMTEDEIKELESQGYNTLTIDRSFADFNNNLFKYNFYRFIDSELISASNPEYRVFLNTLNDQNLQFSDEILSILLQWSETKLINPICSNDPEIRAKVEKYIDRNNVNMIFATYDKTLPYCTQQKLLKCVLNLSKQESVNEQKLFIFDNDGNDVQMNPHQLPLFLAREADLERDALLEDFHFNYCYYCTNFLNPIELSMESFIDYYNDLYELYECDLIG